MIISLYKSQIIFFTLNSFEIALKQNKVFSFHYSTQLAYIIWLEMDKSLQISFIHHLEEILQYYKRDIGFMSLIYHKVIQSSLKEPADF